jgi:hypothetical protein
LALVRSTSDFGLRLSLHFPVLRLVYNTTVFGALHFEYSRSRVRVGSCRDNDLVLLHPSVEPYHCTLAWEEDSFALLPPHATEEPYDDAPRYGPGDTLVVGELKLLVERSPNSIAVPPPKMEAQAAGRTHHGYWKADYAEVPSEARWSCPQCQLRFEDRQIHALGLAGRSKHILCPQCSRELELLTPAPPEAHGLLGVLNSGWRQLRRALGLRPPRRR